MDVRKEASASAESWFTLARLVPICVADSCLRRRAARLTVGGLSGVGRCSGQDSNQLDAVCLYSRERLVCWPSNPNRNGRVFLTFVPMLADFFLTYKIHYF